MIKMQNIPVLFKQNVQCELHCSVQLSVDAVAIQFSIKISSLTFILPISQNTHCSNWRHALRHT